MYPVSRFQGVADDLPLLAMWAISRQSHSLDFWEMVGLIIIAVVAIYFGIAVYKKWKGSGNKSDDDS